MDHPPRSPIMRRDSRSPPPRMHSRSPPPPRHRSRSPPVDDRGRQDRGDVNPGNNLYVKNLSTDCKEADLEDLFSKFGKVVKCQIMIDPHTRENRGFGFVTMNSGDDADAAMSSLDGSEFMGRNLAVEKARRGRARTPTPGRYNGPNRNERFRRDFRDRPYDRPRYDRDRGYDRDRERRYDDRRRDNRDYDRPRYDDRGGRYDDRPSRRDDRDRRDYRDGPRYDRR